MTNKIVDFMEYCSKCIHYDSIVQESPCEECLHEPAREDSHKPLKFEPIDKYKDIVPYKEVK